MSTSIRFLSLFFLLVVPWDAKAQDAYVSLSNGELIVIDVPQCTSRRIGNTIIPMFDIAISPGGVLYGNGKDNRLYRINSRNGLPTLIGALNPAQDDDFNSLVFSAAGVLYAATNKSTDLYRIDTTTANATVIGNMKFQAAGDLTFFEGNLFLAAQNNQLVQVDISDPGKSKLVGKMNTNSTIFGVVSIGTKDCRGGQPRMYALGGNQIYEVSSTTASTRQVCPNLRLSGEIFGAASPLEATPQTRANAGKDTLLLLCETTNRIRLNPLVGPKEEGGSWYGASNTLLATDPEVAVASLPPGDYAYRYQVGQANCSDTATIRLRISRLNPGLPTDTTLCVNRSWKISLVDPDARYQWQDGSNSSLYTISAPGTYTLSVAKTCGSTAATIRVAYDDCGACNLFLPDAFSPNDDGLNDTFGPITDCRYQTFSFRIFNRWGEVIYNTTNSADRWDGHYQSARVQADHYLYQLVYRLEANPTEIQTRSGKVLLLR
jgi:gliding motility-associated-like protein